MLSLDGLPAGLAGVAAGLAAGLAAWLAWPAVRFPRDGLAGGTVLTVAAVAACASWGVARLDAKTVVLALVVLAAAGGGHVLRRRASRRRVADLRGDEVRAVCEELAGELGAGLPVSRALASVAGRWALLEPVAGAQRMGGSVPEALRDQARMPGAGDLRLVGAAWQVAERSGASLALALDAVAAAVRERQRTRHLVASELASARATARLMAALPVFTLAMGSGAGGDPVGFLFSTGAGLVCLGAGIGLALLGLWWIESVASGVEGGLR